MTIFDDPNRESVGLDPIWTEAENPPLPEEDEQDTPAKTGRRAKAKGAGTE